MAHVEVGAPCEALPIMGSVGSGMVGGQELDMRSIGTRTKSSLLEGTAVSQAACTTGEEPRSNPHTLFTTSSNASKERLVSNSLYLQDALCVESTLDMCGNAVVTESNASLLPQQDIPNGDKLNNQSQPRVPTVSGKGDKNSNRLVRPSAFKPVVPKGFHSMQSLLSSPQAGAVSGMGNAASGRPENGTSSRQGKLSDSGRNSLTSLPTYSGLSQAPPGPPPLGPLSASTSHINKLDKAAYHNGLGASDNSRSSCCQRLSHRREGSAQLQPSVSSDDIVRDLEDRLWEREQEVLHMQRNLDKSEAAIAQVFEEKQRVWEREMEKLRQNYASQLQQVSRRAQRTQQALQAQAARLQQDKWRLQEQMAELASQREELERRCCDYRKEQADLLPRLEESKWEVCQKAGEISLLKQQLRESQAEVTQRAAEMVSQRGQLKELNMQLKEKAEIMQNLKASYSRKCVELQRCEGELQSTLAQVSLLQDKVFAFEAEVLGLRSALSELHAGLAMAEKSSPQNPVEPQEQQERNGSDMRRQLERLQDELRVERQQRERQALTFAQERHTWQDEKERVLQYQAQLQLSYVEMIQKNQALEQRIGQLDTLPSLSSPPSIASPPAVLHNLTPLPWPGPSRLERIESTEI